MYEDVFQLKHHPFPAAPQVSHYFAGRAAEAARGALVRCVERAEGTGLLIGPPGTGKSLLLQLLAEQFAGRFGVALLSGGRISSRRDLLQTILFQLRLPYRDLHEGELRLALIDYLGDRKISGEGLLLLIDEAHTLPLRLLDEVRMIGDVTREGQTRARIVLAGSPALEERLTHPKLESCSQRITARCYLEALDREETRAFVRHQIALAGGSPEQVFTHDALEAVCRASDGVPRLVNQVCDHALALALAGGQRQIDAGGIEEAWADLQQLPTPWNESKRSEPAIQGSVIEFGGGLDDLDEPAGLPVEPAELPLEELYSEPIVDEADHDLAELEPEQRIAEIESHLAALDDDEQHDEGGATMTFRERCLGLNPFSEPFAEEEVLVDRFASFDSQFRRSVSSGEGRMLSAMLEPYQHQAEKPRLGIAEQPAEDEHHDYLAHFGSPRMPESKPSRSVEPQHSQTAAVQEKHACEAAVAVDLWEPSDEQLIIVEDDPQPAGVGQVPETARPLEYRQLFARLRRRE